MQVEQPSLELPGQKPCQKDGTLEKYTPPQKNSQTSPLKINLPQKESSIPTSSHQFSEAMTPGNLTSTWCFTWSALLVIEQKGASLWVMSRITIDSTKSFIDIYIYIKLKVSRVYVLPVIYPFLDHNFRNFSVEKDQLLKFQGSGEKPLEKPALPENCSQKHLIDPRIQNLAVGGLACKCHISVLFIFAPKKNTGGKWVNQQVRMLNKWMFRLHSTCCFLNDKRCNSSWKSLQAVDINTLKAIVISMTEFCQYFQTKKTTILLYVSNHLLQKNCQVF